MHRHIARQVFVSLQPPTHEGLPRSRKIHLLSPQFRTRARDVCQVHHSPLAKITVHVNADIESLHSYNSKSFFPSRKLFPTVNVPGTFRLHGTA